jgi:23S rRNA (guanosine2251-2'-O)-methyltransferase
MQNQTKIFGIRAIIEAINSIKTIDKGFLQKGLRGELFNELESLIRNHSINVSYVPVEKLNRLTGKNHQGAVAQISPIEFYNLEDLVINVIESGKTPLFLLLDQISDVRNFGAIIRTAECTGVDGNALLFNAGYTKKGMGLDATFRRVENFILYADRESYANQFNDQIVNYIPSLTKQHNFSLANIICLSVTTSS